MVHQVTVRKMGGSVGATFPREVVARLRIKEGDKLTITVTSDGMIISPFKPDFTEAMEAYSRGARKYRNALRELASS